MNDSKNPDKIDTHYIRNINIDSSLLSEKINLIPNKDDINNRLNDFHYKSNNSFDSDTNNLLYLQEVSFKNLNQIIDDGVYNSKTYIIILLCSLLIFIDGFYLTYFSVIFIPFQSYYNLSNSVNIFVSSLCYLGNALGSGFTGVLSNKFSRRKIIITSLIFVLLFQILLSSIKNLVIFSISRLIGTIFIAIAKSLAFNIFVEYLPIKLRGFVMTFIWIMWGLGNVCFILVCKIFIPTLSYNPELSDENQDFYKAIQVFIFPIILTLILCYFLLEDSPRNLIINGDYQKAKKILDYFTNGRVNDSDMERIIKNTVNSGENKYYEKNLGIKELFNKRIFWISSLLIIMYFSLSFGVYGFHNALPFTLKFIENNSNSIGKGVNKIETLNSLLKINLVGLSGNLLSGILAEVSFLGRRFSMILCLSLAILFVFFSVIFMKYFVIFVSIFSLFEGVNINLLNTYTGEIYPTKIRDYAFGILYCSTRIGALIAQFIFVPIAESNYIVPVYLFNCILIAILILVFFLPKDNKEEIDRDIFIEGAFDNERK